MPSFNYAPTQDALHHAVQLLTLISHNLMVEREDGSHNFSRFDPKVKALIGESFEYADTRLHAQIDLYNFSLHLPALGKKLPLPHCSYGKAKRWIQDLFGLPVLRDLPYTLHFDLFDDYIFTRLNEQEMEHWINDRSLANKALAYLNRSVCAHCEIRIRPDYFNTTTNYSLGSEMEGNLKGLHAGFTRSNSLVQEPHYYVTGYNEPGQLDYQDLYPLPAGRWELQLGWSGAVLPNSEIPEGQDQLIFDFLDTAQAWYKVAVQR